MDDSFLTLAGPGEAEIRILASRFLAHAAPVADEEGARALLSERERRYFDATHNCAAWRLRGDRWRTIDAGEPSGSAGAPILAAIDGAGLVDVEVVVTRYFGGTKLGVGGLVRAYGQAASEALALAPKRRGIDAERVRVPYPYELTSVVMRAIEQVSAHEVEHGYAGEGAEAVLEMTVARSALPELELFLRDQSAGALEAETLGPTTLYLTERP